MISSSRDSRMLSPGLTPEENLLATLIITPLSNKQAHNRNENLLEEDTPFGCEIDKLRILIYSCFYMKL